MSYPQRNKFAAIGEANQYVKSYVLKHIQEDNLDRDLRDIVESQQRSLMLGSPDEAALLGWMIRAQNAKKVLEVGVFRGTTTLKLARAVGEGGQVIGLEISEEVIQEGMKMWREAGVNDRINVIIGDAVQTMEKLAVDSAETFDFIFIDADKGSYPAYYELALKLIRKGGIIAIDNVLRWGDVAIPESIKPLVADRKIMFDLNEKIRTDSRVDAIMQPIADGVYFVRKL